MKQTLNNLVHDFGDILTHNTWAGLVILLLGFVLGALIF